MKSLFVSTDEKVMIQSRDPYSRSREYIRTYYGEEMGGLIDWKVKRIGEVYIPMTSAVVGKCVLVDVRIPYNTVIVSNPVPEGWTSENSKQYKYVTGYRIFRGVYVDGYIREEQHENLNCKFVIGYEMRIYGRNHLSADKFSKTQKYQKKK